LGQTNSGAHGLFPWPVVMVLLWFSALVYLTPPTGGRAIPPFHHLPSVAIYQCRIRPPLHLRRLRISPGLTVSAVLPSPSFNQAWSLWRAAPWPPRTAFCRRTSTTKFSILLQRWRTLCGLSPDRSVIRRAWNTPNLSRAHAAHLTRRALLATPSFRDGWWAAHFSFLLLFWPSDLPLSAGFICRQQGSARRCAARKPAHMVRRSRRRTYPADGTHSAVVQGCRSFAAFRRRFAGSTRQLYRTGRRRSRDIPARPSL